jgi:hypothetical protein
MIDHHVHDQRPLKLLVPDLMVSREAATLIHGRWLA